MTLPASGYFTNAARTNAEAKQAQDDIVDFLLALNTGIPAAAAGGTVDAIMATFSPAITLADKIICTVVAAGANTSAAPTFAPNGLTAHTITKQGGQALIAGDIPRSGFVALLQYNLANTRWELLNPDIAAGIGSIFQAYDADTMKSDVVNARTRAHRFTPVAVTAAGGGALDIDCDLHEECTITLSETTTTVGSASNQAAGKYVVIIITGTTGKSLAWNTNWQKDGAACTIAAPANGVTDMHCFRSNGTNMKHIGSKLAV